MNVRKILLGDIADKRVRLLRSPLSFGGGCGSVFVYLSVTFVHCAQTAEDIETISLQYILYLYSLFASLITMT